MVEKVKAVFQQRRERSKIPRCRKSEMTSSWTGNWNGGCRRPMQSTDSFFFSHKEKKSQKYGLSWIYDPVQKKRHGIFSHHFFLKWRMDQSFSKFSVRPCLFWHPKKPLAVWFASLIFYCDSSRILLIHPKIHHISKNLVRSACLVSNSQITVGCNV